VLAPLPDNYGATRQALHALACYAIAPFRKARTGHIGLRPVGEGFGTPPFKDGTRVVVRADLLVREPGDGIHITTTRAAAEFLGIELSADPGVGRELPPFEPDAELAVDRDASLSLGRWYALGAVVLAELEQVLGPGDSLSEPQLWPEHFDLATVVVLENQVKVNVGFSPGDRFSAEPYVYVGPQDLEGVSGKFWNVPFGAYLPHRDGDRALDFVRNGIRLLRETQTP
jgi:hypothetical protein